MKPVHGAVFLAWCLGGLFMSCGRQPEVSDKPEKSTSGVVQVEPYVPEADDDGWKFLADAGSDLFHLDFKDSGVSWTPVHRPEAPGIAGELPGAWRDGSPAGCRIVYGREEEDGVRYLRWTLNELASGESRARLETGLPSVDGSSVCVVRFKARSSNQARLWFWINDTPLSKDFLTVGNGWGTYEFKWKQKEPLQNARFAFSTNQAGQVDFADIRLMQVRPEALRAKLEKNGAVKGNVNYLGATRFPRGLPVGWILNRNDSDGDDVVIRGDRAEMSPSGYPPLWVESDKGTFFSGEPFLATHFWQPQTASFSVKGSGSGRISIRSGLETVASRDFQVEDNGQWQRVSLGFSAEDFSREYCLRIDFQGKGWFDGFRVGAGGETAYQTAWQAEVALQAGRSSRVIFAKDGDDLRKIAWTVTGAPQGAVLKGKVVNVYGEQIRLPGVALAPGKLVDGEWGLPLFPVHSFGSYRVESWVEDGKGKRVSSYAEIVLTYLHRPRYWDRDAPDSPFGVHVLSTNRALEIAKAIGLNWVRTHDAGISYVGWYALEKEKGVWAFDDAPLERYRAHHLMILGQLGTAPAWASAWGRVGAHSGHTDKYYEPDKLSDFQEYVGKVVARYKGMIGTWEVWNEPWHSHFWKVGLADSPEEKGTPYATSENPQASFAALMKASHTAAKKADPEARIVGFNSTATVARMARCIVGSEWTKGVLDAGGADACEVFSYHNYTSEDSGYPGDKLAEGYHEATGPLVESSKKLPVWMTEGSSVPFVTGRGFYNHLWPLPDSENPWLSSDRLCRYVVALLGQGVEKVFLYSMHKYGNLDNGEGFRLLIGEDGYLHPSGAAFAALAWFLEDKKFLETKELSAGLRAYVFQGDGEWVAVLSPFPGSGPQEWPVPQGEGIKAFDLFGNPLSAEVLRGTSLIYLQGKGKYHGL